MSIQNILKFYGSRLDIKLDSSEYYDYELTNASDYDASLLDFSTPLILTGLTFDSDCLNDDLDNLKPLEIEINSPYTGGTCDFTIAKRTSLGWTLDFVFNRENIDWSGGTTFYYWGIKDEEDVNNYADNNLSFSFTDDGRIKWTAYRYSGYCETSGFTDSFYLSTGQTPVLCSGGTSDDFSITITFERYNLYTNCEIENEGGWNDLVTGWTVTNPYGVLSGDTEEYTIIETLNEKWLNEKQKRLGTLKIYLNGKPIYKLKNWEEVVPSLRNSSNPIVQVWGGGTTGIDDLHLGNTEFNLKHVYYYEEPLSFLQVYHNYKTLIKPNYSIVECSEPCVDNITFSISNAVLTEDDYYLTTENNNIIIF